MRKPNLDKIIADNLNKTRNVPKIAPATLPTNGWLNQYTNGGIYLSDKAKATQFGQYAYGGSSWMLTNPKPEPVMFPRLNNGGLVKAKNGLEEKINMLLGNPMYKAEVAAENQNRWFNPKTKQWEQEDPIDNVRHSNAGRYTAEAIANKFPKAMKYFGIPQVAGFLGSTALGIGHELTNNKYTLPHEYRDYSLGQVLREAGEDAFNNMVGAGVGVLPFASSKQKTDMLRYLSDNNLIPDGIGRGSMYFRKRAYGGDISIPDLQEGNWLAKYETAGTVSDNTKVKKIIPQQQFTTNPQELALRNLFAQQQAKEKQQVIKQGDKRVNYKPTEPTTKEKFEDIVTHPAAYVTSKIKGDNTFIPGEPNLYGRKSNVLDLALGAPGTTGIGAYNTFKRFNPINPTETVSTINTLGKGAANLIPWMFTKKEIFPGEGRKALQISGDALAALPLIDEVYPVTQKLTGALFKNTPQKQIVGNIGLPEARQEISSIVQPAGEYSMFSSPPEFINLNKSLLFKLDKGTQKMSDLYTSFANPSPPMYSQLLPDLKDYESWARQIHPDLPEVISSKELKNLHEEAIDYFKGSPLTGDGSKEIGMYIKNKIADKIPSFVNPRRYNASRQFVHHSSDYPYSHSSNTVLAAHEPWMVPENHFGYDISKLNPQQINTLLGYQRGFDQSINAAFRFPNESTTSQFYRNLGNTLNEGITQNKFPVKTLIRRGIQADYDVQLLDPITHQPIPGKIVKRSGLNEGDVFKDESFLSTAFEPSHDWGINHLAEGIEIPGGGVQSYGFPNSASHSYFTNEREIVLPKGLIRRVKGIQEPTYDKNFKYRTEILNPYETGGWLTKYDGGGSNGLVGMTIDSIKRLASFFKKKPVVKSTKKGEAIKYSNQYGNQYVDLQKDYGLDPFSKIGVEKAKEISAANPNIKFLCTAEGCSQIATNVAATYGNYFDRGNAWDLGNKNKVVATNPDYEGQVGKGILHDPKSFSSPESVWGYPGAIIGLNRANAGSSEEYADQELYPGSRGYEHVGYMLDKNTMLHGTGPHNGNPSFYMIDWDLSNGVSPLGLGKYQPVEAIEPSVKGRVKGTVKSWLGQKEYGGWLDKYETAGTVGNTNAVYVRDNKGVKGYNPASDEYKRLYESGQIGAYDEANNAFYPTGSLPEVTVTAQRPKSAGDFFNRYIDKVNKEYSGSLEGALFAAPVMSIAGLPQAAATYALNKKGKLLPSEAMGIDKEHPYLSFAADAILDPANYFGAEFLKEGQLAKTLKNLDPNIINSINSNKGSLDNVMSLLKKLDSNNFNKKMPRKFGDMITDKLEANNFLKNYENNVSNHLSLSDVYKKNSEEISQIARGLTGPYGGSNINFDLTEGGRTLLGERGIGLFKKPADNFGNFKETVKPWNLFDKSFYLSKNKKGGTVKTKGWLDKHI